jgi:hypothetical protein
VLKKKFLLDNYKKDSFLKGVIVLSKKNYLLIEDYTYEFEYLMLWCDVVKLEEQTMYSMLAWRV